MWLRSKKSGLMLLAVFVLPFTAAMWLLSQPELLDKLNSTAKGEWLKESFYLDNPKHKWLIVGAKDRLSTQQQLKLSNLHRALGKNREDVIVHWVSSKELQEKARTSNLSQQEQVRLRTHSLFLADPQGLVLMTYSISQLGKPLLSDVKHLIKHNPS